MSEKKLTRREQAEQYLQHSNPQPEQNETPDLKVFTQSDFSPKDVEQAQALTHLTPLQPLKTLTDFNNNISPDLSLPQQSEIFPKPDYSAQLANAFGVIPSGTDNGLGHYVNSLVESIYNGVN